jgi:hypothetical protein
MFFFIYFSDPAKIAFRLYTGVINLLLTMVTADPKTSSVTETMKAITMFLRRGNQNKSRFDKKNVK